jgi:hypothetical protein
VSNIGRDDVTVHRFRVKDQGKNLRTRTLAANADFAT